MLQLFTGTPLSCRSNMKSPRVDDPSFVLLKPLTSVVFPLQVLVDGNLKRSFNHSGACNMYPPEECCNNSKS